MSHTPKPWFCDERGVVTGGPDNSTSIAITCQHWWDREGLGAGLPDAELKAKIAEMKDNGRLIAAAPELLEACTELFMQMRREGGGHQAQLEQALAAIRKATEVEA